MKRREFMGLVGGAAAWPAVARAQQPAMPVIGLLIAEAHELGTRRYVAFREGLAESGYVVGRNVGIEYRWAEGRVERYQELATDLVRRNVAVIASLGGIPAATAAKEATQTIPIVFSGGMNPVEIGLVESLARPGRNVTGVTNLAVELGPKRLETLHELVPKATTFALLLNPDHPNSEPQAHAMQTAARTLGLHIHILYARTSEDFGSAFERIAKFGANGLVVGIGQPLTGRTGELGEFAARHRIPAIHESREFVVAGGLASYAAHREDAWRLTGVYVGKILKGEKPAELPVQQSTKVELIINMKSAKTLGVTVPLSLLGRADEVIE